MLEVKIGKASDRVDKRVTLSVLDSHFQVLSLSWARSLEGRHLSQDQRLYLQGVAEDREPKQWRVGNPITEGLTDPAKKLECSKGNKCPQSYY